MIFRAFYGDPVPEAQELSKAATSHHAEVPTNPANGEVEDTDVGFPGPHHTIAERALPMRVAMGVLAVGAVGAGLVQVPGVDDVIDQLPAPDLRRLAAVRTAHPRRPADLRPVPRHACSALAGIAIAYRIWVREPAIAVARARALRPLYDAVRATSGTSTS